MSEKAKHTPGPWDLSDIGDYADFDGKSRVVCSDDMRICAVHAGGRNDAENEANARLIAAAPDLLARLQAIIDWADLAMSHPERFNASGVSNLDGPVFDMARDVLAKAKAAS